MRCLQGIGQLWDKNDSQHDLGMFQVKAPYTWHIHTAKAQVFVLFLLCREPFSSYFRHVMYSSYFRDFQKSESNELKISKKSSQNSFQYLIIPHTTVGTDLEAVDLAAPHVNFARTTEDKHSVLNHGCSMKQPPSGNLALSRDLRHGPGMRIQVKTGT